MQYFVFLFTYTFLISDGACGGLTHNKIESTLKALDIVDEKVDIYLNITQLITKYNYRVEEYTVVTPDGYELKLFRIPGNGKLIFLMHGLLSSADDWISLGEDVGLGFLLAQRGYDVWMGNARGNKYGRYNINNPPEKEFWDFSFHEIGVLDLPTMIDFTLNKTKKSSLIFIGHSQGTSNFFALCSIRPEYNAKISFMIALSPIAWLSHLKSPVLNFFRPYYTKLQKYVTSLGIYEVFKDTAARRLYNRLFCGNVVWSYFVCQTTLFLFGGFDYGQSSIKKLPVFFNHFPSGSSTKQLWHYAQLINSGYFRQYDYGSHNVFKYGTVSPPSYPLENITVPIALFYSENDFLSAVEDVKILKSSLPNVVEFYKVKDKNFNHFDFLVAKDLGKLVLPKIIELIDSIN